MAPDAGGVQIAQANRENLWGFNALEFFPGQPDEMGVWPKGVVRPWEEIPITPDEPDGPDGGCAQQGYGREGGSRVRRVRRVACIFGENNQPGYCLSVV